MQYKYQISIDGTVAAYRFPYLMAAGSLIFKQDSEYYEHYYHDMQPWVHYIPLKKDISDIEEKLHWAIEHDDEVIEHVIITCIVCYNIHVICHVIFKYTIHFTLLMITE